MSKREEIREGVTKLIEENTEFTEGKYSPLAGPITDDKREMWCKPSYLTKEILTYLHSQGVVRKVEKELPTLTIDSVGVLHTGANFEGEWVKKEAGYEAVESLI